jgi:hypothetical protein
VGFVIEKATLGLIFSEFFRLSCQFSEHHHCHQLQARCDCHRFKERHSEGYIPAASWFHARLIFDSEDRGERFFQNVGSHTDYMVLYPSKWATFITIAVGASNPTQLTKVKLSP